MGTEVVVGDMGGVVDGEAGGKKNVDLDHWIQVGSPERETTDED